jgi:hypothetical protein
MIFINNALKKIGKEGLIVSLKANNFYEGEECFSKEDFDQLFEVYRASPKIDLPTSTKNNLFLCILYYEYNHNEEARKILLQKLLKDDTELLNGGTEEDQLHILFNIIEIEIKIRTKDEKDLKLLYNKLVSKKTGMKFEDYILQKHYFAYLKFLLRDYKDSDKFTNDIISDIDEHKDLVVNNIIKYIRIRNVLLKVKMLELMDPVKNNKDIISHLECLFAITKNTKEDFAICVGIKMLSLQSKEIVSYEECIKLIKEMLNILKRETLFGKSHKNILEQYLYLNGLLGYYNSINDDFVGVIQVSRKIDKYLTNVQDLMKSNDNKNNPSQDNNNIQYGNLYWQYNYYNAMLKSSFNFNNTNNASALRESQQNMQKMSNNKIRQSEMDLMNRCILEKDDLRMSTQFRNMEELFKKWTSGQKIELKGDKIILMYFSLYNQVSLLTKNIVKEMNADNRLKNIQSVRKFCSDIIEMTGKQVIDKKNEFLKKIFQLPFFKNLFNRLYYVKLYSYFLERRYQDCLNNLSGYQFAKIQYELETPKSNEYMSKIEADCLFKLKRYKEAEIIYDKIISMNSNDAFVHFNLGLAAYFTSNDKTKSLGHLKKASELFKRDKNEKNREITEEILKNLNN